jgi:arylsulfatase A-like enzyme
VQLNARTLLALSVMLGLATGLLELVVHFIRRQFINSASMGALQLNQHALWMVPVSDALIFGACGLVLAGTAVLTRARWIVVVGVFGLCFLWAYACLLTFRGLTSLACATLAAGVARQVTIRIRTHPELIDRLARIGLPALIVLVAGLACIRPTREKLEQHRLPLGAARDPNVLFIVLDTVRAGSLSLHGYNRDTSPELERLAQRGVWFAQARSTAAWTLPSHASMFTGRWPFELSARQDQPLDQTYPTLAELLRDRGYATAGFVGNTFFCNSWYGLNRGFLHYEDVAVDLVEIIRSSDIGRLLVRKCAPGTCSRDRIQAYFNRKDAPAINRDALAWLATRPAGRPYFVFLNYYDAHDPYLTAEAAARHFGLRPTTAKEISALRNWLRIDHAKLPARTLAVARDGYDDCIAYLDDQVGNLLAELETKGLLENTIIIVTSDHGELLGEHGAYGHGSHLYEPVVHVPLVVVAPRGIPAGQVVTTPVSLRDLPATVIDLVGLSKSPFPGQSLARYWSAESNAGAADADFLLSETADDLVRKPAAGAPARALAQEGKVYIRSKDGREALYDVASDPSESRDLSGSPALRPVLERFRDKMRQIDDESTKLRGAARRSGAAEPIERF